MQGTSHFLCFLFLLNIQCGLLLAFGPFASLKVVSNPLTQGFSDLCYNQLSYLKQFPKVEVCFLHLIMTLLFSSSYHITFVFFILSCHLTIFFSFGVFAFLAFLSIGDELTLCSSRNEGTGHLHLRGLWGFPSSCHPQVH